MDRLLEILALMQAPGGHVPDQGWRLGDEPIEERVVAALLRKGWLFPTRRPVVTGSPLTGRLVISAMGRRAARLQKAG
jgi:hypothetical protein